MRASSHRHDVPAREYWSIKFCYIKGEVRGCSPNHTTPAQSLRQNQYAALMQYRINSDALTSFERTIAQVSNVVMVMAAKSPSTTPSAYILLQNIFISSDFPQLTDLPTSDLTQCLCTSIVLISIFIDCLSLISYLYDTDMILMYIKNEPNIQI